MNTSDALAEPRYLDERAAHWAETKPGAETFDLDYRLNDSGAKLLVVGKDLRENIDKLRDKLTHFEHVIDVTPAGGDEYEAMLAAATPTGRADDVELDDVAIIMYSSGTTGKPKGAADSGEHRCAHGECA